MKHKHAELIKAWADGAEIQCLPKTKSQWHDISRQSWYEDVGYRIKPEPKPDVVSYLLAAVSPNTIPWIECEHCYGNAKIKLTRSGETGELIKAEVIK